MTTRWGRTEIENLHK